MQIALTPSQQTTVTEVRRDLTDLKQLLAEAKSFVTADQHVRNLDLKPYGEALTQAAFSAELASGVLLVNSPELVTRLRQSESLAYLQRDAERLDSFGDARVAEAGALEVGFRTSNELRDEGSVNVRPDLAAIATLDRAVDTFVAELDALA